MAATRTILLVTLICAIIGIVLVAIALGTNHWRKFSVDRDALSEVARNTQGNQDLVLDRSYGFFRECFDEDAQRIALKVYKSPLGFQCRDPQVGFQLREAMSQPAKEFVHLKRTYIGLYAAGLAIAILGALALCVGFAIKRPIAVCLGGFLCFLAACLLAAGVGTWHRTEDILQKEMVYVEGAGTNGVRNFYNSVNWPETVRGATKIEYGWSYIIFWIGTALLFLAGILTCCGCWTSRTEMKKKKLRKEYEAQYYGPSMKATMAAGGATAAAANPYANYSQQGYYNSGYAGSQYGYDPYYGMQTYSGSMQRPY